MNIATNHDGAINVPQRTRVFVDAERVACIINGFWVADIKPGAKGELHKGWPETRGLPRWNQLYSSTAIITESLRAFDFDIDDIEVAAKVFKIASGILPLIDTIVRTRGNSPRGIFLFRAERPVSSGAWPGKRTLKLTSGVIEILGAGQQFVAFGPHPTGAMYEWLRGSPVTRRRDTLPIVTDEQIEALAQALDEAGLLVSDTGSRRQRASEVSLSNMNGHTFAPLVRPDGAPAIVPAGAAARIAAGLSTNQNFIEGVPDDRVTIAQAKAILEAMPNDYPVGHPLRLDHPKWRNIAYACHSILIEEAKATGVDDHAKAAELFTAFEEFSAAYAEEPGKPTADAGKLWDSTRDPQSVTAGTLIFMARERITDFDQRGFTYGE